MSLCPSGTGASCAHLGKGHIDGHSKPTCMGGGYSAVFNVLTVYAMTNYIYQKNGFPLEIPDQRNFTSYNIIFIDHPVV